MDTKAGWKTTEFWVSGATAVVTLLVLGGFIKTEEVAGVNDAFGQMAAAAALIITQGTYIIGRVNLKKSVEVAKIQAKVKK